MPLNVVIACGGTGGHLFPGISVGEALQRRGHDVLALISEKNIDALATQGYDHLRFETVPAIGMPRLLSPQMLKFGFRFLRTMGHCKRRLKDSGADAVLGMGGFTSMPPVLAGRRLGKKTFLHESNAYPGKANRLTAKFVTTALVGLEECAQYLPREKTRVVGTPLRTSLMESVDKAAVYRAFDLSPDFLTLSVMGGSQGARGINNAVCEALAALNPEKVQVIHISGEGDLDFVREKYAKSGIRHHVAAFSHRMQDIFAVTDLVVSRAGASSLSELAYFGAPSILIPYPYAADDHQLKNAQVFARQKAAVLLEERQITGTCMEKVLNDLLLDTETRNALGKKCASLGVRDAAERICDIIEETCATPS
ncbi:MAG: UDP-N-acetylglucosamine--N-acetylmuramyl-(pentapeptide) pyrophosphoryl-undecaprenol N-acetylglucosamine transferase [Verrucomicrobiales bacterium]|jgi:UDP-N-acetylglucosamine--N-acetylmuramyl-(pentapeptide) pyrophosphoryl-undecaprenol N-acetylglucosamine transferase